MTDEQVCETVEKYGANEEECARLNASLSCLRNVHMSGEQAGRLPQGLRVSVPAAAGLDRQNQLWVVNAAGKQRREGPGTQKWLMQLLGTRLQRGPSEAVGHWVLES